jgi:hypothetical protein
MFIRLGLFAVLIASLCSGCSGDPEKAVPGDGGPDSGNGGTSVNGLVAGDHVPEGAKAVVVWSISSGSPDYAFKYGEGSSSGSKFTVTLSADPPAEAINSYGVGVGVVALVPASATVPEGKVTGEQLELLGLSASYAVIWKAEAASGVNGWMKTFPSGFACGRCVPAPSGESFDSFTQVDCSQVQIDAPSDLNTLHSCNWT